MSVWRQSGYKVPWFILYPARGGSSNIASISRSNCFNSASVISRPPTFLAMEFRYPLAVLRVDAIAQSFEQRRHIVPKLASDCGHHVVVPRAERAFGFGYRVDFQATEKCDVPLAWFAIDAHALDQDGFQARVLVVVLAQVRIERLRTVLLPSNEHAVVYSGIPWTSEKSFDRIQRDRFQLPGEDEP